MKWCSVSRVRPATSRRRRRSPEPLHGNRPPGTRSHSTSAGGPLLRARHRFFVARDLRGDAAFFDLVDFAPACSGSFLPPVSRFHSSKVAFEIFPSTSSCANFRRCAWLLNGMRSLSATTVSLSTASRPSLIGASVERCYSHGMPVRSQSPPLVVRDVPATGHGNPRSSNRPDLLTRRQVVTVLQLRIPIRDARSSPRCDVVAGIRNLHRSVAEPALFFGINFHVSRKSLILEARASGSATATYPSGRRR